MVSLCITCQRPLPCEFCNFSARRLVGHADGSRHDWRFIYDARPIDTLAFMPDAPLTSVAKAGECEGTIILRLTGPLTQANLFSFQSEFRSMCPPVLIVEFADLTYMDSAGPGLMMNGCVSAERDGRRFLLAAVSDRVMALLRLTKVDTVLPLFPTAHAAEAFVATRGS